MTRLAQGALLYSLLSLIYMIPGYAQSINSGTVLGTVTDPTGAVVAGAQVLMRNPVTGYEQTVRTDTDGKFRFNNIPQNNYRWSATAPRFAAAPQESEARSS